VANTLCTTGARNSARREFYLQKTCATAATACLCAAGCVIARQRPGTAKGFIFISMEDETGIANVIVTPDVYEQNRLVVTRSKFLLVEGRCRIRMT